MNYNIGLITNKYRNTLAEVVSDPVASIQGRFNMNEFQDELSKFSKQFYMDLLVLDYTAVENVPAAVETLKAILPNYVRTILVYPNLTDKNIKRQILTFGLYDIVDVKLTGNNNEDEVEIQRMLRRKIQEPTQFAEIAADLTPSEPEKIVVEKETIKYVKPEIKVPKIQVARPNPKYKPFALAALVLVALLGGFLLPNSPLSAWANSDRYLITPKKETYNVTFYVEDIELGTYEVEAGQTIQAPVVEVQGYQLIGWSSEEFATGVNSDLKVYALLAKIDETAPDVKADSAEVQKEVVSPKTDAVEYKDNTSTEKTVEYREVTYNYNETSKSDVVYDYEPEYTYNVTPTAPTSSANETPVAYNNTDTRTPTSSDTFTFTKEDDPDVNISLAAPSHADTSLPGVNYISTDDPETVEYNQDPSRAGEEVPQPSYDDVRNAYNQNNTNPICQIDPFVCDGTVVGGDPDPSQAE